MKTTMQEWDGWLRRRYRCYITLASRAAIQGGVHPELAFSLCDAYIMKIEQLKDLMDTQAVVEGAQTRFAMMVPFNEPLRHQALRAAGPPLRWLGAIFLCAKTIPGRERGNEYRIVPWEMIRGHCPPNNNLPGC